MFMLESLAQPVRSIVTGLTIPDIPPSAPQLREGWYCSVREVGIKEGRKK
jgi:hypothetical protein